MTSIKDRYNVHLDPIKLATAVKKSGMKEHEVAASIGRDRTYLTYIKQKGFCHINTFNLLIKTLNVEPDDIMPDEYIEKKPEPAQTNATATVAFDASVLKPISDMLLSLSKEVIELRRDIVNTNRKIDDLNVWKETEIETMEKILSKLNTNTLQLAKIKDTVGAPDAIDFKDKPTNKVV